MGAVTRFDSADAAYAARSDSMQGRLRHGWWTAGFSPNSRPRPLGFWAHVVRGEGWRPSRMPPRPAGHRLVRAAFLARCTVPRAMGCRRQ